MSVAAGLFVASPASAAVSVVRISRIQWDSPGVDDRSNASLNAEWVAIHNYSTKSVLIGGYRLSDRANHVYTFGYTTMGPGVTIYVHTGHGADSYFHRYQQSGNYIWNNDGDLATLRNAAGVWLDNCGWSYRGTGGGAC